MNTKKITSIATGLALVASLAFSFTAFAQGTPTGNNNHYGNGSNGSWQGKAPGMMGRGTMAMKLGIFGTVTVVNGNIITVNGRQGFGSTTSTVNYTVDASNSTVRKNNATSTVSSIVVNDKIFAVGTVSGTNVTATSIIDGMMMRTGMQGKGGPGNGHATTTPPFTGNGEPLVAGTISVVNGNTLTVTTSSNVTYTVDATSAKILEGNTTATVSSLAAGHKVLIQGAVNGTSITASTILDQQAPVTNPGNNKPEPRKGFLGGIGDFFAHLFGF